MERIPAYLAVFLLRIRKHGGESDYFERRFAGMGYDRVWRETYMAKELARLGLILLSEKTVEKSFEAGPPKRTVGFHPSFVLLPAGHYLLRELAVSAVGKASWTLAAAFLGGLAAVALGNL